MHHQIASCSSCNVFVELHTYLVVVVNVSEINCHSDQKGSCNG